MSGIKIQSGLEIFTHDPISDDANSLGGDILIRVIRDGNSCYLFHFNDLIILPVFFHPSSF